MVSFPHFYQADPKYINAIDGLSPNKDEHETYLDLQPVRLSFVIPAVILMTYWKPCFAALLLSLSKRKYVVIVPDARSKHSQGFPLSHFLLEARRGNVSTMKY